MEKLAQFTESKLDKIFQSFLMADSKTKRQQTSITVDQTKWRAFGAALRLRGSDYSEGLELLIDWFLEYGVNQDGTLGHGGDFSIEHKEANIDDALLLPKQHLSYHKQLEICLQSEVSVIRQGVIKAIQQALALQAFTAELPDANDEIERRAVQAIQQFEKDAAQVRAAIKKTKSSK